MVPHSFLRFFLLPLPLRASRSDLSGDFVDKPSSARSVFPSSRWSVIARGKSVTKNTGDHPHPVMRVRAIFYVSTYLRRSVDTVFRPGRRGGTERPRTWGFQI